MSFVSSEDMFEILFKVSVTVTAVVALALLSIDLRFFYVEVLFVAAYWLNQKQKEQRITEKECESILMFYCLNISSLLLTGLVYLNNIAIVFLLIWIAN